MNPYRCETCKKPHTLKEIRIVTMPFYCCDEPLPANTPETTMKRGCGSHSDFDPHEHAIQNAITFACERHDKEIRQAERDTLYKEIWGDAYADGFNRGCEEREQSIQQAERDEIIGEARALFDNGNYNGQVIRKMLLSLRQEGKVEK